MGQIVEQEKIYQIANKYNFNILDFYDCPSFYGSWSIKLTNEKYDCFIRFEGRDGYIIMNGLKKAEKKLFEKNLDIREINKKGINELTLCDTWLHEMCCSK